jgi:hypothetical protein
MILVAGLHDIPFNHGSAAEALLFLARDAGISEGVTSWNAGNKVLFSTCCTTVQTLSACVRVAYASATGIPITAPSKNTRWLLQHAWPKYICLVHTALPQQLLLTDGFFWRSRDHLSWPTMAAIGIYEMHAAPGSGGVGLTALWEAGWCEKYAGQPTIIFGGASSVGQFGDF